MIQKLWKILEKTFLMDLSKIHTPQEISSMKILERWRGAGGGEDGIERGRGDFAKSNV